ncbi:MAG: hypothetical protein GY718_13835 [Lentisphaerae bacterium]|nr:hypothetical protein [Lentisphaerota bacterium]
MKGRVGPVNTGLLMDDTAMGLRGGEICSQDLSEIEKTHHSLVRKSGVFVLGRTKNVIGSFIPEIFPPATRDLHTVMADLGM